MAITRRHFLSGAGAAAPTLLNPQLSEAWFHGNAAATGQSVLGGFHEPAFAFKNFIKNSSGSWQTVVAGIVDADGYLTSAPPSNTGPVISFPALYAGRYRITWTGSAAFNLTLPATVYSGGVLVSGLGVNTGAVTANCTIIGNPTTGTPNGYVEFDFGVAVSGAADNGSGSIRLTVASAIVSPNGTTGEAFVSNVGGVPNATGQWTFVRIDSTHVDLIGSTFAGSYTSGGSLVYQPFSINSILPTGQTYSGFSGMALCRSTAPYTNDLTNALSGDLSKCFNDDFTNVLTDLNPSTIRFLDVAAINSGNISRSAYSTPVTSIGYFARRCPPAIWSGSTTGTDAYTVSSYPDMPVEWTDGEVFQFKMVNAPAVLAVLGAANNVGKVQLQLATTAGFSNGQKVAVIGYNGTTGGTGNGNGVWTITVDDGTHITLQTGIGGAASVYTTAWTTGGTVSTATLDCGTRGAKILCNSYGEAPSRFQTISANNVCTAIYDSLQDCLLVAPVALSLQWPLAVRVALCNKIRKNYWHQVPAIYDLTSVATDTAYIRDNLSLGLKCYAEMANEPWNLNFPISIWLLLRGMCVGFASSSASSYTGLYNRRVHGQMTTIWGARSGLKRVIQWQAANPSAGFKSNTLEGAELNGTTFPLYASAGYSNYDTAPNRPVDFCDVLSYAPYYNGAVLTASSSGGLPSSPTLSTADKNALKAAVDNYATGVPANIASAFAWMDSDILTGTRNGTLGDQTLSYLNTNYYPAWQTTAAAYSKPIVCYEGNYQGWYPSVAQWDAAYGSGGSTYGGAGGLVFNMWIAYKQSANFKAVVRSQWNDQRAISSTLIPGIFTFGDNFSSVPISRWAVIPVDIYKTPYFTTYDALRDWNNGL